MWMSLVTAQIIQKVSPYVTHFLYVAVSDFHWPCSMDQEQGKWLRIIVVLL
jgi:hypothetical protein